MCGGGGIIVEAEGSGCLGKLWLWLQLWTCVQRRAEPAAGHMTALTQGPHSSDPHSSLLPHSHLFHSFPLPTAPTDLECDRAKAAAKLLPKPVPQADLAADEEAAKASQAAATAATKEALTKVKVRRGGGVPVCGGGGGLCV